MSSRVSEIISSVSNPRIRRLVELQKKSRLRRETGLFVIEGARLCGDAPDQFIEEVYVTEKWLSAASGKERNRLFGHPLTIVSEEAMAKASGTSSPQGILCAARIPSWKKEELLGAFGSPCRSGITGRAEASCRQGKEQIPGRGSVRNANRPQSCAGGKPLLLLLEDLRDPGNLGTIFRTAEAAGATGILMNRETVDLFNPKTVRATMSAVFRLPFYVCADLAAEAAWLREREVRLYAAHLGGRRSYDSLPLAEGSAFFIGNEANGLSEEAVRAADEKIIIPMAGGAESLNAAMAAGILLFEAARQRRNPGSSTV